MGLDLWKEFGPESIRAALTALKKGDLAPAIKLLRERPATELTDFLPALADALERVKRLPRKAGRPLGNTKNPTCIAWTFEALLEPFEDEPALSKRAALKKTAKIYDVSITTVRNAVASQKTK